MSVDVHFGRNIGVKQSYSTPQVMDAKWGLSQTVEVGSVTASGCPAAELTEHLMARVFNGESSVVFVSFGVAPNAATDDVYFRVPAGIAEYFGNISPGDKCSVASARS